MSPKYKSNKRAFDSSEDEAQSLKKPKVISTDAKKDGDGNTYWELSGTRRVQISDFKGKRMVNLREYYQKDGDYLPGKKGISLPLEQFSALVAVLPQIFGHLGELGDAVAVPDFGAAKEGKSAQHTDRDDDEVDDDEEAVVANGKASSKAKRSRANHEFTSDEE